MRTLTAALFALALIGCGGGDKGDDPPTGTPAGEPTGSGTGAATGTGTGAGTGTGTGATSDPDADGDGSPASLDCDDTDADRFPGNPELCDAVDHDCDGDPSNGLAFDDWYADLDGDGYGDPATLQSTCDGAPVGFIDVGGDCEDGASGVNPGATEVCDGVDQDCTGYADDGLTFTSYFADVDADGYGDPASFVFTCDGPPAGYLADSSDCDDATGGIYPGATEICDGIDQDCDGYADNGLVFDTWYADVDQDGQGDGYSAVLTCDGAPLGHVANASDCDDGDASSYTGAPELCDAVDNNCNEQVDDGISSLWYADADGDGYGDPAVILVQCPQPAQYVSDDQDCNDGDATVSPAASEACDGVDRDCSGAVDDGAIGPFWYVDLDGDGSAGATSIQACAQPGGTSPVSDDCDDANPAIHPGADIHVCDLVDTDCDGQIEEWLVPADGTLDNVIAAASAGDQICITAQVFGSHTVDRDLVIEGVGAAPMIGQGAGSAINIANNLTVELRNLRLMGSFQTAGGTGGGLRIGDSSDVVLVDVAVEGNTVETQGGGIYVSNYATLTMIGGSIRNNIVTGQGAGGTWMTGGGMFARSGSTVLLDGVVVENNLAVAMNPGQFARGGGIAADNVDLTLIDVGVFANQVDGDNAEGGGLWVRNNATLNATRLDVRGNLAAGWGASKGGGVYLDNADATLENLVLAGNVGTSGGATTGSAVYQSQCAVDVAFATVFGNSDDGTSGGSAWWLDGSSTVALSHTIAQDNTSTLGSGSAFRGTQPGPIAYFADYANAPSTWSGAPPTGTGMVTADADFVDTTGFAATLWDLHLSATSILIDAGDPLQVDADSSAADYGAYGGPYGAW